MSSCAQIKVHDIFDSAVLHGSSEYYLGNIPKLQQLYKKGESIEMDAMKLAQSFSCGIYFRLYPSGSGAILEKPHHVALECCCNNMFCFGPLPSKQIYVVMTFRIVFSTINGKVEEHRTEKKAFVFGPTEFCDGVLVSSPTWQIPDFLENTVKHVTLRVEIQASRIRAYERAKRLPVAFLYDLDLIDKIASQFRFQEFDSNYTMFRLTNDGNDAIDMQISKEIVCYASEVLKVGLSKHWQSDDNIKGDEPYAIDGHRVESLKDFLSCLHYGSIYNCNSVDERLEMLLIADKYMVDWLKNDVIDSLAKNLSRTSVIQCFLACETYTSMGKLRDQCITFLINNFIDIELTSVWCCFKKEHPLLAFPIVDKICTMRRPARV